MGVGNIMFEKNITCARKNHIYKRLVENDV